jgi:hypothetical protein
MVVGGWCDTETDTDGASVIPAPSSKLYLDRARSWSASRLPSDASVVS